MKKKWFVLLIVLALVGILAFTLVACNDDKEEGPPADADKVTVTFVQGDKTLRTEQVEKGSAAAAFKDYVPEIDGYDFLGWYAAPSLMIPFDFDTVVFNENTTIFAKAASTDQPVDNRTWYIAGSGKGEVLIASNWGADLKGDDAEAKALFELEKVEGKVNEFSITLDLFEGDQFQFLTGFGGSTGSYWLNQHGAGYLTTRTGADGEEYFSAQGGLGDTSTKIQNINVLVDGNYTLTLKTYPADDYENVDKSDYDAEYPDAFFLSDVNYISWVRNGDPVGEVGVDDTPYDFYIKGQLITEWGTPKDAQYKMTETDGVYTLTIELQANDNFMFYSYDPAEEEDGALFIKAENLDRENSAEEILGSPESGNLTVSAAGTYTFTWTRSTGVLVVTKA